MSKPTEIILFINAISSGVFHLRDLSCRNIRRVAMGCYPLGRYTFIALCSLIVRLPTTNERTISQVKADLFGERSKREPAETTLPVSSFCSTGMHFSLR